MRSGVDAAPDHLRELALAQAPTTPAHRHFAPSRHTDQTRSLRIHLVPPAEAVLGQEAQVKWGGECLRRYRRGTDCVALQLAVHGGRRCLQRERRGSDPRMQRPNRTLDAVTTEPDDSLLGSLRWAEWSSLRCPARCPLTGHLTGRVLRDTLPRALFRTYSVSEGGSPSGQGDPSGLSSCR